MQRKKAPPRAHLGEIVKEAGDTPERRKPLLTLMRE